MGNGYVCPMMRNMNRYFRRNTWPPRGPSLNPNLPPRTMPLWPPNPPFQRHRTPVNRNMPRLLQPVQCKQSTCNKGKGWCHEIIFMLATQPSWHCLPSSTACASTRTLHPQLQALQGQMWGQYPALLSCVERGWVTFHTHPHPIGCVLKSEGF